MTGFALNYLALVARDTEAVCRFLGGSLGLMRTDLAIEGRAIPFFGIGDAALGIFDPEDPYLDAPASITWRSALLIRPGQQNGTDFKLLKQVSAQSTNALSP